MKLNSLCNPNSHFLFSLCSLILITVSCQNVQDSPFSESAINALSTMEVAPPFQIELVASEPFISDPVDMMIDENGKMYVVEMHGYPLDESGTGKIKLLPGLLCQIRNTISIIHCMGWIIGSILPMNLQWLPKPTRRSSVMKGKLFFILYILTVHACLKMPMAETSVSDLIAIY